MTSGREMKPVWLVLWDRFLGTNSGEMVRGDVDVWRERNGRGDSDKE